MLQDRAVDPSEQNPSTSEHKQRTSTHEKCAIVCQESVSEDLAKVAAVWDRLPPAIKTAIVAMVETTNK
jgi:hypothetical protein